MSARLLAVITPGDEATALASLVGLVTMARAAEADIRLACFRELPVPRVDRYGRVVADTDAGMARIERETRRKLVASARPFDGVSVKTVVRLRPPGAGGADRGRGLRAADRGSVRRGARPSRPASPLDSAAPAWPGATTRTCWWCPSPLAPPSPGRWAGQPSDRRHPSQHIASEIRVLGPAAA